MVADRDIHKPRGLQKLIDHDRRGVLAVAFDASEANVGSSSTFIDGLGGARFTARQYPWVRREVYWEAD